MGSNLAHINRNEPRLTFNQFASQLTALRVVVNQKFIGFNECFVSGNDHLVFDEHLPGEGKELIKVYNLKEKKYLLHLKERPGKTLDGQKTMTVKKQDTGMDIIVF